MKKIIFFCTFLLISSTTKVLGQIDVQLSFESLSTSVPNGSCVFMENLPALAYWSYTEDSPSVCRDYETNGANNGNMICTLQKIIEDDIVIRNEVLIAPAWDTTGGGNLIMELSFDYANLGTTEDFRGDFGSSIVVTVGEGQFYSIPLPPYDPEIEWTRVVLEFCPSFSTDMVTITPEILSNAANSSVVVGIDNILYRRKDAVCPCVDCSSFKLVENERYVITGWVREDVVIDEKLVINEVENYQSMMQITFGSQNFTLELPPSGTIIDGWQKISGEFTVPEGAEELRLELYPMSNTVVAYYDDIRIHPINANLKSFVYDQTTQKLMAELDENNYATFYEYDKEGGLVRVKKETEKGVFTIQETRSSNSKKE